MRNRVIDVLFLLQMSSRQSSGITGDVIQFIDFELEYGPVLRVFHALVGAAIGIVNNGRVNQMRANDVAFITLERVVNDHHFEALKRVTRIHSLGILGIPCIWWELERSGPGLTALCDNSCIPSVRWGSYAPERYANLWESVS